MKKKFVAFFRDHQLFSVLLFIFTLVSIRFLPFYFGKTLYFGDNYSLMVPGKLFTAQWLLQGVLPLWNPYIFAGIPWIGDVNQSVLYPSTIFFLLFKTATALNVLVISHYLLTGLGMFFLARLFLKQSWQQFFATGLWTLSTQIAGSTNNFSTIQSLSWLPWILWCGWYIEDKRAARLLFGFLVVLQFLGGYPQHVIFSIAYAVVISIWKKREKKLWGLWFLSWMETGLYTLFISAVSWVPFADLLLRSTRMDQSLEQAQVGSLHPLMLIKPLAPYFFDHAVAGMKWGPAWSGQPNVVFAITLFGMVVLLWSLWQWKRWDRWSWLFAGTTVFTIVFSLGEYLPGYTVIQQLIPLFRIGRYPSMVLILGSITVILWFVRSLEHFEISKKMQVLLRIVFSCAAVGVAAVYIANWLYLDWLWKTLNVLTGQKLEVSIFHTIAKDAVIIRVITATVFGTIVSFLVALWLWSRKSYWLFVVVLLGEMLFSTQGMFLFGKNEIYPNLADIPAEVQSLPTDVETGDYRVLTRNINLPYTDFGTYWEALVVRKPFSDSFIDAKELQTHDVLQHLVEGYTPNWNMVYGVRTIHGYTTLLPSDFAKIWQVTPETRINFIDSIDPANPLLAEWAVKYYLVDGGFKANENLAQYPVAMTDGMLSARELPETKSRFRLYSGADLVVTSLSETPNATTLSISPVTSDDDLIIADRFDQDLKSAVNGVSSQVENWQGMRKLHLPAGTTNIKIWYQPKWFWRSVWLTGMSSVLAIGYITIYRKQFSSLFK